MEEAEPLELRLGRPALAGPVHGDGLPRRNARQVVAERRLGGERGHGLRPDLHRLRRQVLQEPRELHLHPEGPEPGPVGLAQPEGLEVEVDRHLAAHRRQLAREERLLAMRGQGLAELAGDEGQVFVEPVDGAELGEELDRGLLPHAGDAGDVVDRVAHERQHVRDLRGVDPPALAYLGRVVADPLPRPADDRQHGDPG